MLHGCNQHFVTLINNKVFKRSGKQVQRLGGTTSEYDFTRLFGMDEICNGLSCVFVGLSRLLAQIMYPTMDVAILVQVIFTLALNDTQRLLRGGSIVEIHQRLAVDLLVKDRELVPYCVDIHIVKYVKTQRATSLPS